MTQQPSVYCAQCSMMKKGGCRDWQGTTADLLWVLVNIRHLDYGLSDFSRQKIRWNTSVLLAFGKQSCPKLHRFSGMLVLAQSELIQINLLVSHKIALYTWNHIYIGLPAWPATHSSHHTKWKADVSLSNTCVSTKSCIWGSIFAVIKLTLFLCLQVERLWKLSYVSWWNLLRWLE